MGSQKSSDMSLCIFFLVCFCCLRLNSSFAMGFCFFCLRALKKFGLFLEVVIMLRDFDALINGRIL